LKNSQLTSGNIPAISGTGHQRSGDHTPIQAGAFLPPPDILDNVSESSSFCGPWLAREAKAGAFAYALMQPAGKAGKPAAYNKKAPRLRPAPFTVI
jgi:hypothetical protein